MYLPYYFLSMEQETHIAFVWPDQFIFSLQKQMTSTKKMYIE